MKPSKKWCCGLLAAALFVSCEWVVDAGRETVDSKLRGTWVSAVTTDQYCGKLVIGINAIVITGYEAWQTPQDGDDNKRPFNNLAKGAPLPCYTEDGKLFIKTPGGVLSFPYQYTTGGQGKFLIFEFGGRGEALRLTGN